MSGLLYEPVIEMAFGYGAGQFPPDEDWVDVTDTVLISDDAVVATRGRGAVRSGIDSGRMTFVLDNSDGRYSVSNPDSPFVGQLKPGIPVRLRSTVSASGHVVWSGWVVSGWTEQITQQDRQVVEVEAGDLFEVIAQADAPATAFEAEVLKLPTPDRWLVPGPYGWEDRISGRTVPHTGVLEGMDSPSVDGGENAWGQEEPDGYGRDSVPIPYAPPTTWTVVSAFVRFQSHDEDGNLIRTEPQVIISQRDTFDGGSFGPWPVQRLHVEVGLTSVDVEVSFHDSTRRVSSRYTTSEYPGDDSVRIMDGEVHHVLLAATATYPWEQVPAPGERARLWIDGREVLLLLEFAEDDASSPVLVGPEFCRIGTGTGLAYQGIIDHLIVWTDFPPQLLDTAAKRLTDGGRLAWVGDRLDQRLSRLLDAMDLGDAFSQESDVSGIVTLHGYRREAPLELLQKIEDTEQGLISVDRLGKLRFLSRDWPTNSYRTGVAQIRLTDDPELLDPNLPQPWVEMHEAETVIGYDPRAIINVAEVNSEWGRLQVSTDPDSIDQFGRMSLHLSGLMHSTDRQSRAIADWLVHTYGQPRIKAERVAFLVENLPTTTLQDLAVIIEEGWRVRILKKMRHGSDLDIEAHVIGVEHRINVNGHLIILTLDDARARNDYFVWESDLWDGVSGWAF